MGKVDIRFRLLGSEIPADHGYLLFAAVSELVPAFHHDEEIGIHPISGRLIGNRQLAFTERSLLTIRIDSERVSQTLGLTGKALRIGPAVVQVGVPHVLALEPSPRLYSRLVVIKGFLEPDAFLEAAGRQLQALEIRGEVSLVPQLQIAAANQGRTGGSRSPYVRRTLRIRDKEVVGFAVRAEGLTAEESVRLQEQGLGGRRRFGCGVFVPAE